MTDLKIGDVVQLKSGGPAMTVDVVKDDRDGTKVVHTVWYEDRQQLRYACLPVDVFVKVSNGTA